MNLFYFKGYLKDIQSVVKALLSMLSAVCSTKVSQSTFKPSEKGKYKIRLARIVLCYRYITFFFRTSIILDEIQVFALMDCAGSLPPKIGLYTARPVDKNFIALYFVVLSWDQNKLEMHNLSESLSNENKNKFQKSMCSCY